MIVIVLAVVIIIHYDLFLLGTSSCRFAFGAENICYSRRSPHLRFNQL